MESTKRPSRLPYAAVAGLLILCAAVFGILSSGNRKARSALTPYLEAYRDTALQYLVEDPEFQKDYGASVTPEAKSWSYAFKDPAKYPALSFTPKYPATAEEFDRELSHMEVGFLLPDGRTCSVRFEDTPEGGLEITGWSYADGEDEGTAA